jgi:hypothetical protein
METSKARALMERVGLRSTPFENPEVSAMAAICEILRALPDEASRLRVMRWSFGRFNPEFKRPLVDIAQAAVGEPAADPLATDMRSEIAAVAPEMVGAPPPRRREPDMTDFGRQLLELGDLFPAEPTRQDGDRLRPVNLDAF